MKVKLKTLWETADPLARLADLKFEEESLAYKVGRIHQALLGPQGAVTLAGKSYHKLVRKHGEELKIDGQPTGRWHVPVDTEAETEFYLEWNRIAEEDEEFWGQPIALADLRPYLKQIRAADLGALAVWLIKAEE